MTNLGSMSVKSKCSRATSAWQDNTKKAVLNSRERGDTGHTPQSKEHEPKQKTIPRAGRMKFLSSVLTILSKASTATQCPELDDHPRGKGKRDRKSKKKNSSSPQKNSKTLSLEDDLLDLVALQQTKAETIHSSVEDLDKHDKEVYDSVIKLANQIPVNNFNKQKTDAVKKPANDVKESNTKQLGYGRGSDPATQVAQEYKDNKKVYSFFLDIIQSSINQGKSKMNLELGSSKMSLTKADSSKLYFDMKECIANTLAANKSFKKKRLKKLSGVKLSSPSIKMTLDDTDFIAANVSEKIDRSALQKAIPALNKKPSDTSIRTPLNKPPSLVPPHTPLSNHSIPFGKWKAPPESESSLTKWKASVLFEGPWSKLTPSPNSAMSLRKSLSPRKRSPRSRKFSPNAKNAVHRRKYSPRKNAAPIKMYTALFNNGSQIKKLKPSTTNASPITKFGPILDRDRSSLRKLRLRNNKENPLLKFKPLRMKVSSQIKLNSPSPSNKTGITRNNKNRIRDNENKLFKILKHELSQDNPKYNKEPQNFYQSLKIAGKNKILGEKVIRFDNTENKIARPMKKYDDLINKKSTKQTMNQQDKTVKNKKLRKQKVTNVYSVYETKVGFNSKSKSRYRKRENLSERDSHASIEVESYNYSRPVKNEDIYRYSNFSILGGSSTVSKDDTKYTPQWYTGSVQTEDDTEKLNESNQNLK